MVGLWLLVSVVCAVVRSEQLNDTVRSLVANTNRFIARNNIDQLSLPDFTDSQSKYELLVKNIKIGNFSSAELQEVAFLNRTQLEGSSLYTYDVVLSLKPATISYDFQIMVEGLIPLWGKAVIVAHNNSYRMEGTLLLKEDGTCRGTLEKYEFVEMNNFDVTMQPRSFSFMSAIKNLLNAMAPQYMTRINKVLQDLLQKQKFQEIFSNIVCANVKK